MEKRLDSVEVNPKTAIQYSIIWLHGLGADGHDFEPIVPELHLPEALGIRFIFPHAPIQPVTINGGLPMRAWYDITEMSITHHPDENGIRQSCQSVQQLIQHEQETFQLKSHQILLAGFSQGGAIALTTALTFPEKLAGVIALSTYLPSKKIVANQMSSANLDTPFFMAHGLSDPIVPLIAGTQTKDWLLEQNYPVTWHTYPMQHNVCPQQISDLSDWLGAILAT